MRPVALEARLARLVVASEVRSPLREVNPFLAEVSESSGEAPHCRDNDGLRLHADRTGRSSRPAKEGDQRFRSAPGRGSNASALQPRKGKPSHVEAWPADRPQLGCATTVRSSPDRRHLLPARGLETPTGRSNL